MARSYLFIPANEPRMLQNAYVFEADAIILDLEDSVAIEEKTEARWLAKEFLSNHPKGSSATYVRINTEMDWMERDLRMLKSVPLDGVVLPKLTLDMWHTFKKHADATQFDKNVYGIVETPAAFFELDALAGKEAIKGLILGGEDLVSSMNTKRTLNGDELLHARSLVRMACAKHGIQAIDTPWTTLDEAHLEKDITHALTLGYDGKCAIHPNQVPLINKAFSPEKESIDFARRVVEQYEKTKSMRFSLDGQMIDKPVLARAQATLKKARHYGLLKEGSHDNS
ncbi:MAG: HpcH/HpaI aldolase/citrate lyase family protein [Bacillota bacterium]